MKPEKWPTLRIAMYGAFAGAAYAALLAWGHWTVSPEWAVRSVGGLLGGAFGADGIDDRHALVSFLMARIAFTVQK